MVVLYMSTTWTADALTRSIKRSLHPLVPAYSYDTLAQTTSCCGQQQLEPSGPIGPSHLSRVQLRRRSDEGCERDPPRVLYRLDFKETAASLYSIEKFA